MESYCFLADTDSSKFLVNTGANRVIVNDAKLLNRFQSLQENIQGIGGKSTMMCGTGQCRVPICFDCGSECVVIFELGKAIYVPSLPYNIIPPQMLSKKLCEQGATIRHELDDRVYELTFVAQEDQFRKLLKAQHQG